VSADKVRVVASLHGLFARGQRWLNASLENRALFALSAFGIVLVVVLALAAVPFVYTRIVDSAASDRRADIVHIAERIEHRIGETHGRLDALARNPLIIGSLMDADGREDYLRPLLGSFQPPYSESVALILFDLNLKRVAESSSRVTPGEVPTAIIRQALDSGHAAVSVSTDGVYLQFVAPVFYPPSSAWIGALLLEIPLASVMASTGDRIAAGLPYRCYRILSGSKPVFDSPCSVAPAFSAIDSQVLSLPAGVRGAEVLSVLGADDGASVALPLVRLLAQYLVFASMAAIAAWYLLRRRIREFIRPLVELNRVAEAVAADPGSTQVAPVVGDDEVARLARSFNTMLAELRGLQDVLTIENRLRSTAMARSAEREALVAVAATEGLWDWNIESEETYISPKLFEMSGYDASSFAPGASFFRTTCHPDDLDGSMAVIQAHLRGETDEMAFDARMVERSGRVRWVLWKGRVVQRNQNGMAQRMVGVATDVTARRRAEVALQASERRYRSLFENLPVGVFHGRMTRDPDGKYEGALVLDANPAFVRLTGIVDPVGKRGDELIPNVRQTNPEFFEHLGAVAAGAPMRRFESHLAHTGRWFAVATFSPAPDEFIAAFDDITAGKQAQQALQRSEALYRSVIDSMVEGVVVQDATGHIVGCNPRAGAILGRTTDELLGAVHPETVWDIVSESGQPVAFDALPNRVTITTGRPCTDVRLGVRRGDGRTAWLSINTSPLLDAPGNAAAGVVATFLDIAERRQMSQALAENTQLLRQAFVNSPIGLAILDLDGSVIRANPALCRLTGLAESDLAGRTLRRHVRPDEQARDEFMFSRLMAGAIPEYALDQWVVGRSGNDVLVRCTTALVRDEAGKPLTVITQVEDVTERKRAENEDLAANILSAQEVERARLSHELHDEIGQTLTALNITLQRARQRCRSEDGADLFEPARQIIGQLTDDVRRIAHRLRPSELDQLGLAAALRSHVDKLPVPPGLVISLNENLGRRRMPLRIELCCFRVVQEALTNCFRHASASQVDIELRLRDTGSMDLAVRDDGVGFDVDTSLRSVTDGGSLGLVGMRERVVSLGGRIDIRSRPGAGTAVMVVFGADILNP
jgi:PAS domain S-box-containing protein